MDSTPHFSGKNKKIIIRSYQVLYGVETVNGDLSILRNQAKEVYADEGYIKNCHFRLRYALPLLQRSRQM
jgi:hypothetical protein